MRTKRTMRAPLALVALGAMMALGCGDGVSAPATTGDLRVNVKMLGARPDSDGYSVHLSSDGGGEFASQAVAGQAASIRFGDLTPGAYMLSLASLSPNCSVEGEHPLSVAIELSKTTFAVFTVSCPRDDATAVYRHQNEGSPTETFYLYADSTFLLDQGGPEFNGTYSADGSRIVFSFIPNAPEWGATGTLHGDCMSVVYTFNMSFDGFEDGEFCK